MVLLAAVAMVVQDVLAVCLVQAEARNKAGLAAGLDAVMWIASIAVTSISVTALQSHHLSTQAAVLIAVTLANVAGSYAGVKVGERLIKPPPVRCSCANCQS
jgi:hypothetical protein